MPAGAEDPVEVCGRRLAEADAGVRRVAIMDLIRLAADEVLAARANAALLAHLPRETDEKAAILIVRQLGRAAFVPAQAALQGMYDDRGVPARLAHAAILAHDQIELSLRAR
jgi:hypothetical protein